MSWTLPKTWNVGDVMTSTDLNTYVRDNTNALAAVVKHANGAAVTPASGLFMQFEKVTSVNNGAVITYPIAYTSWSFAWPMMQHNDTSFVAANTPTTTGFTVFLDRMSTATGLPTVAETNTITFIYIAVGI